MRQASFKKKTILFTLGFFLMFGTTTHADELIPPTDSTTSTEQTTEQPTTTPIVNQYQVMVNYLGKNIFSNTISPTSTWFADANQTLYTNEKVTALGALAEASRQGNFPLEIQNYDWGYYVSSISNHIPTGFDGWVYNVNQIDPGWVGINDYLLQPNDSLTVFYSVWPWKIEANTTTVNINSPITFTTSQYLNNAWQIAPSTTISLNTNKFITDNNGQYIFTTDTTGTINAFVFGSDSWPQNSPAITITVTEPIILTTTTTSTDDNTTSTPDSGNNSNGNGGGSYTPTYSNLDIEKSIQYLTTKQQNGDFSSVLHTDWAAIAFGAYNRSNPTSLTIKNYLLTDPSSTAGFNSVSDYARRAMALMSLGINPYQTKTNYIKKITDTFNGTELVDKPENQGLFNDDIFALIPLTKAGYTEQDEIVKKVIAFILYKQTNNNWGSIDLTAAAIQALKPYSNTPEVNLAITNATTYLKTQQQANGSFVDNPFSTSWAIQAGDAMGEKDAEWVKKAKDYLAKKQLENDNGSITNDVWATTQAIPAALDKPWSNIMTSFSKPEIGPQPGGTPLPSNPTTTPSTTTTIASTTITTSTLITITTSTTSTVETAAVTNTIATASLNTKKENPNTPIPTITKQLNTKNIQTTTVEKPTDRPTDSNLTTLSSGPAQEDRATDIINNLPIDTSHKNSAKKVLAISGGGATALGLYLGLRLLKNVI